MNQVTSARTYARNAYGAVIEDLEVFLAQAGWWVILLFVTLTAVVIAFRSSTIEYPTHTEASIFVAAIFLCALEIAWFRHILLGQTRTGFEIFRFRMRHLKCAGYMFLLSLPFYFLDRFIDRHVTPTPYQDPYGIALKIIGETVSLYFALRLGMGFALLAVDAPTPLRTAWRLSGGDQLLLIRIAILTFVPFTIVAKAIYLTPKFFAVAWHVQFGMTIVSLILQAIGICVGASVFAALLRTKLGPTDWGRIRAQAERD